MTTYYARIIDAVDGMHPSEALVRLADDIQIFVDRRSIADLRLRVRVVDHDDRGGLTLVEFPRETTTGAWRAWMDDAEISIGSEP